MNAINSSSAGVKITYDSLNDRFIMESKTDPANGLLKAMGLIGGTYTAGTDAEFDLDGVTGMKFTIEGVTYSLKGVSSEPVKIDVKADIDAVVENIKNFVNSYNEMLAKIKPLTDDQKKAMSEKKQSQVC